MKARLAAGAALLLVAAPITAQPISGIAAELGRARLPLLPTQWPEAALGKALEELAAGHAGGRQQRRWIYAMAALSAERPDEALGALTVMAQDEPDLRLLAIWRLAAARAQIGVARHAEALALLDAEALRGNPEACAWRLLALSRLGAHAEALTQLSCARRAIIARPRAEQTPFLKAAASSALALGRSEAALTLLQATGPDDEQRLLTGEAKLALARHDEAMALLRPLAAADRQEPLRVRARAALLEAELKSGRKSPAAALQEVQRLRFTWRGDQLERRLNLLAWDLALTARRPRINLDAAAALLRYHPGEPRLPAMLRLVAASFERWLRPGSGVPLPLAAGLMWDHRDLLPQGAEGDALVRQLAARLAAEGLHGRAADLLEHQLAARVRDVAQGPVSIDVARLQLLAGRPQRALEALRRTADTLYPEPIAGARLRLEAIALFQLGRQEESLALLAGVGGQNGELRAELHWRRRDWAALASAPLPPPGRLDEPAQVRLLRRAIALGMTGDERGLRLLRERHRARFAGLSTASAFDLLTAGRGEASGDMLATALAALPAASPAGTDAELLDLLALRQQRQAPPAPRG